MTDLVDQMFPPIHRQWEPEFTDTNFWKPSISEYPLPDLRPSSPALSVRSDTSNQSTLARLRNLSLRRPISPPISPPDTKSDLPPDVEARPGRSAYGKNTHLRQLSSLERVGYALGLSSPSSPPDDDKHSWSALAASSTAYDSGSEDEGDENDGWGDQPRRERRRSIASMPGSMPGSEDDFEFGAHDHDDRYDDEGEGDEQDLEQGPELDPNETFDDDLFAAGEMAQVPFL
jgi:phosphatidate phosphatase LPIN